MFKIGLIDTVLQEDGAEIIPQVSWWFRLGNTDMVCYTTGGHYYTRLAMLHTVAGVCNYTRYARLALQNGV